MWPRNTAGRGVDMYYDLSPDLDHYLGTVVSATRHEDDGTVAELARAELPYLVHTIRALLEHHQPDSRHRCPTCHGRRWLFWRRPNMPCRAYLAAHRRLLVLAEVADTDVDSPAPPPNPVAEPTTVTTPQPEIVAETQYPQGKPTPYPRNRPDAAAANRHARHSKIERIGPPLRAIEASPSH